MINGEPLELTTRELSVLEALMSRIGWVISKEQLLERLYSYSEEASSNAIEVYIHRLRKKIEPAGVDAAGGVEKEGHPRKKDIDKMAKDMATVVNWLEKVPRH